MECNGDLNAEKRMKDAKFTRVGLGWDGGRTRYIFNFIFHLANLILTWRNLAGR